MTKVLVVDANEEVLAQYAYHLKRLGHVVVTAQNPYAAIQELHNDKALRLAIVNHELGSEKRLNLTNNQEEWVDLTGDCVVDNILYSVQGHEKVKRIGFMVSSTEPRIVKEFKAGTRGVMYNEALHCEGRARLLRRIAHDKKGGWFDQMVEQLPSYDPQARIRARQRAQALLAGANYHKR